MLLVLLFTMALTVIGFLYGVSLAHLDGFGGVVRFGFISAGIFLGLWLLLGALPMFLAGII